MQSQPWVEEPEQVLVLVLDGHARVGGRVVAVVGVVIVIVIVAW